MCVYIIFPSCCCSVAQLCPTLCDPMDCSMPGFPVPYHLPEFAQTHVHWVDDTIQPSHPLFLPSPSASIFPSIRVFSSELALYIRWPKYWSFNFSISLSNEYSGLISFRINWVDLLAYYNILSRVPCATQYILAVYLFYIAYLPAFTFSSVKRPNIWSSW